MYLLNSLWFENKGFQSFRFILESFYFLSGIALFITGIFQIFLAKKDLKTKSTREALTVASQQCDKFSEELIPLIDELNSVHDMNNLRSLRKNKHSNEPRADFGKSMFTKSERVKIIEFLLKPDNIDFVKQTTYCTNKFEAFSTYFTSGVADSEVAFNTIGDSYCRAVETLYFNIHISYKNNKKSYRNIVELYNSWSSKLDSMEYEEKLAELKNKNVGKHNVYGA